MEPKHKNFLNVNVCTNFVKLKKIKQKLFDIKPLLDHGIEHISATHFKSAQADIFGDAFSSVH